VNTESENPLEKTLEDTFKTMNKSLESHDFKVKLREVGTIVNVARGTVSVRGLKGVMAEELLRFENGQLGMAFNVGLQETGVVLLDESDDLVSGGEVHRTGRVLDIPVGDGLLGRVLDGQCRALDNGGSVEASERLPVERPAHGIMDRLPVTVPLQTGLKVVDALIPIGRGQRELIIGDRQTGKTAIALDTILNQKNSEVLCIYCAVGKRASAVAKVIDDLKRNEVMEYCIVVVATEEDPPGLQFITPYAAATMAEYFMGQGRDVLIVFDDLTRHARAYRELSLLLRRPPGREAFPGDIFYIHSRLLERSTHLKKELGGGSVSALPIVETEAQNISAYIPTNLISITDGQIYLSPDLFQKGILPAVDVGRSVSRVGGKTQLPAYRAVAGDLRLAYSQFEELEAFARFGTQLDQETRQTLERGRRVREVLKQPQYGTLPVVDQIAVLVAVNEGVFDRLDPSHVADAEDRVRARIREDLVDIREKIEKGSKISKEDIEAIRKKAEEAVQS